MGCCAVFLLVGSVGLVGGKTVFEVSTVGGKIVASMDSGGATSGMSMGMLGANHSSAMMSKCMVKLNTVLHQGRGFLAVS